MNELAIYLILILLLFAQVGLFLFIWQQQQKSKQTKKEENDTAVNMIKQDIDQMRQSFEGQYRQMSQQYGQISKEMGRIQEIGHYIKDFQDFLRSPKTRGNIGEQILKDLLEQVLPRNSFNIQHQFQSGERVDAIIKTSQGIIPIDAKFPLENFQKFQKAVTEIEKQTTLRDFSRDIKKHIDDISKKYILPGEGTVDFAVMYIPSETVYYEIITNQTELLNYGYQRKVYFVSPNTFYYFMKVIMIGLEGAKIEEVSKMILKGVKGIQQETLKFAEDLNVLLNHIERTKGASSKVELNFHRLSGKIDNLNVLEVEKGTNRIERP
ncbi:MAG: DNA recombination protein RmuC [bacterium]|nr:DNA recombination protein RmuC [bacterium]